MSLFWKLMCEWVQNIIEGYLQYIRCIYECVWIRNEACDRLTSSHQTEVRSPRGKTLSLAHLDLAVLLIQAHTQPERGKLDLKVYSSVIIIYINFVQSLVRWYSYRVRLGQGIIGLSTTLKGQIYYNVAVNCYSKPRYMIQLVHMPSR